MNVAQVVESGVVVEGVVDWADVKARLKRGEAVEVVDPPAAAANACGVKHLGTCSGYHDARKSPPRPGGWGPMPLSARRLGKAGSLLRFGGQSRTRPAKVSSLSVEALAARIRFLEVNGSVAHGPTWLAKTLRMLRSELDGRAPRAAVVVESVSVGAV